MFLSKKAEIAFTEYDKQLVLGALAYCYFEKKPTSVFLTDCEHVSATVELEHVGAQIKVKISNYPDIVYCGTYFFLQHMDELAADILDHAAETYKEEA